MAEIYSRVSVNVQYLVADISLPDSVFTESSYHENNNQKSTNRQLFC